MPQQPPLGFVLLTHDRATQALRLVERLNMMFDSPPIGWHHDFGQAPLVVPGDWTNVALVRPHVATRWGSFSLVEAVIRAMRSLYSGPVQPDWCAVLSGTDYPIKPAARILEDLSGHDFDAYMQVVEVKTSDWSSAWEEECSRRYHTVSVGIGRLRARSRHPLARRLLSPFTSTFGCYAGSNWFYVNSSAVREITAASGSSRRLARHLRHALLPEECYFQTVLCNAPTLRIRNQHLHYVDWSGEHTSHPRTLDLGDLDALRESSAHFARKLDLDACPELHDELDRLTAPQIA